MARFSDLLPEARIGLSQAPDPSIEGALRRGAIRLLRETHIWQADLDPVALRAGIDLYELTPEVNGAKVEKLLVVKVDGGEPLGRTRLVDLRALRTTTGAPSKVALSGDGLSVVLWPRPADAEAGKVLTVFAVLTLTPSARELPDFLVGDWHDAIVAAAHAEMYANKAMPWYDQPKAMEREMRYVEEAARAKRKQHSGGHAPLTVRPNPWK